MIYEIGLDKMIGFDMMIKMISWLFDDIFVFGLLLWIGDYILLNGDHWVWDRKDGNFNYLLGRFTVLYLFYCKRNCLFIKFSILWLGFNPTKNKLKNCKRKFLLFLY